MSQSALLSLLGFLVAVGSFWLAIFVWRSSKRDAKTARKLTKEANATQAEEYNLQLMTSTIDTLRSNYADLQVESNQVKEDLVQARKDVDQLNAVATTALANVAILTEHIQRYVPEGIKFPNLRRVQSNGR